MKRILIVRTDRMGDVVLSTPVVRAVRKAYPDSFIAMMVTPYTREIVEGAPGLNEALIFDKKKFRGVLGSLRFASYLRDKGFDLAIVLHPVIRIHMILFLAGIKRRIGYDKKWGFLLTDRMGHTKQLGEKHEIDYNLDLLRLIGIDARDRELFIPVRSENNLRVEKILRENGFRDNEDFVVLHPGASCSSKRWPPERFAAVADAISERLHKKVVVVSSVNDKYCGLKVGEEASSELLDLSGDLSVGELIALISKAKLMISNDSGPVHIAVALKVPVVAIFGRNQPGLSFKRWGPSGGRDAVIYKDVGCVECLAHDCKIGFKCLMAIEPEQVIQAAQKILQEKN